MSAHTPGPWIIRGNSIIADETEERLEMRVRIHSGSREDIKANARLIAAAPDLLSELTALLAMCERQDDFNDDSDGGMLDRARAAIAKATGAA